MEATGRFHLWCVDQHHGTLLIFDLCAISAVKEVNLDNKAFGDTVSIITSQSYTPKLSYPPSTEAQLDLIVHYPLSLLLERPSHQPALVGYTGLTFSQITGERFDPDPRTHTNVLVSGHLKYLRTRRPALFPSRHSGHFSLANTRFWYDISLMDLQVNVGNLRAEAVVAVLS